MTDYEKFLHAMQSGVAMKMNHDPKDTSPKLLRVGVNAAMADQGGLVTLLIEKGIFTTEEYIEAITASMKREKDMYEKELTEHYNSDIKLG